MFENQELRLYSFINFYISPIQHGIQTGHAAVRLVRKYSEAPPAIYTHADLAQSEGKELVKRWADQHETFIVLNGGDTTSMDEIERVVQRQQLLPWVSFREPGINNALTCVSVVVPAAYFEMVPEFSKDSLTAREVIGYKNINTGQYVSADNSALFDFIRVLKSCGLAR